MTESLMTQEQVAEMFGVTVHAVRKWRSKNLLPYMRVGKTVRMKRSDVMDFYARHEVDMTKVAV